MRSRNTSPASTGCLPRLTRAWEAGAGPGDDRLIVDTDSFLGEVPGYQKQGAAFGYIRRRSYHPILATRPDTGEVLHIRLRKGSAGSWRGALRFVEELIARTEPAGATGARLLQAGSAFPNNQAMERLERCGWRDSISVRMQAWVPSGIAQIPESEWAPLTDLALGPAQRQVLVRRRTSLQALAPRRQELLTPGADAPAGRPVSRARRSRGSPRNKRITTPSLRRALQRTSRSPTARCSVRWTSSCAPSIPASVTLDMLTSRV
jgi:hypothetical protein